MKSKLLLLLVLQTLFSVETIVAQITFQKTFGGTNNDQSFSVQQTTDGGYIFIGFSSLGPGVGNIYLIKTNANGDTLWTKTIDGTFDDIGYSVQQTTDGGYIINGYANSFGAGNNDVYLIKTDANGNLSWTKTFGGTFEDFGYSVHQTTDGGYITTGYTNSFGAGYDDVYLIKTDSNGDSLWTKTYGGTNYDVGYFVEQTNDGGYIITGYTTSFGTGPANVYLIKTDASGNSSWTKTFGGIGLDKAYSVQQTTDGGYIISGWTNSFGVGDADVYLIKTDANGDSLWTKTFGGTNNDRGYSVQQTTDGGYIVTGYTTSFGAGGYDIYLIKTDYNGDSLWAKTLGGSDVDYGNSVQQTTDGGYIVLGATFSFGAGSYDIYLVKTDSLGNSGCNEGSTATIVTSPATIVTTSATTIVTSPPTIVTSPATIVGSGGTVTTLCTTVGVPSIFNLQSSIFNISPNPFSDVLNITAPVNDVFEIVLYDITSRKLLQQTFTNAVSINTSQFAKGIYVYELRNPDNHRGGVIKKGKIVKQ